jgi:Peroxisomal biogenesis factor 11 (PEX11)
MSLHGNTDFRDKVLKLVSALVKVQTAVVANPKESKQFLAEVGRVRKWMKFLRVIKSIPNLKSMQEKPLSNQMELMAEVYQAVCEDVNTLHKSGAWTGILNLEKIDNIAILEDRAWFLWAVVNFVNSLKPLKQNYENFTDDEKSTKKLIGSILTSLKFLCETGDSSLALLPDTFKKGKEQQLVLISAILGGTSAVCGIHKILDPSYY